MKNYWRMLRNHRHPLKFVAARLLMATGLSRLFVIQQRGYRLRFHRANLSSQLWIDPLGRDDLFALLRDYLHPGDRVVDVGANIGETVLIASGRVGAAGCVVGIEPHPRTFEFLRENVELNGVKNVRLIMSAVGASEGVVRFSDDRRDDMNRVGAGHLEVAVARLDDLVPGTDDVALLKVDVEGYERFVFEGAPSLLARARCIQFEVSSEHFQHFGYSLRDLLVLLEKSGFRLFRIPSPGKLERISPDYMDKRPEDLVALSDEADFVRRTAWSLGGH